MQRIQGSRGHVDQDFLAAEEPLEIRIEGHSIAVVMRTPGEDAELAAGFLVTEGLVKTAREVVRIQAGPHCRLAGLAREGKSSEDPSLTERGGASRPNGKSSALKFQKKTDTLADGNVVNVSLACPDRLDLKRLTRHVFSSSSCGICSKASIEAVRQQFPAIQDDLEVSPRVLLELSARLGAAQENFQRTGGLHACALFDLAGGLVVLREDVGRHNALDKVVGWALLNERLPLRGHLLLLSGRVSFEMMQKALAAGIPLVAAISAPSSLAVAFAQESGQTLVGFLRSGRMNVYAGAQRVAQPAHRRAASKSSKTGVTSPD